MKKYIIIPPDDALCLGLQVNHPILGTPLRYSDDTILGRFRFLTGFYPMVYDTLEDAVAAQAGKIFAEPIFEVELKKDSELITTIDTDNRINPYTLTSPDNIKEVLSATHAGIKYNLSAVWEQHKQYLAEIQKLFAKSFIGRSIPKPEAQIKIDELRKLVWSLQGKQSYAELTDILRATNEFLGKPSLNLEKYKTFAKSQKDAPSPAMQAVGLCMLALAAIVAAMGASMILCAGAGLAGCGLFAMGRRGTGVYKAMNDLSNLPTPSFSAY